MRLKDIVEKLKPVYGLTSLVAAFGSCSHETIQNIESAENSLEEARKKLKAYQEAQDNCRSDAAYWGHQSSISYWKMICDLLEAATLKGPDNLPDVPSPDIETGFVMDVQSRMEGFGRKVLELSRKL